MHFPTCTGNPHSCLTMDNFRVRIFQPIVPEYRVALFDGLAARYQDRIDVQSSPCRRAEKSYPLHKMRYDYGHEFHFVGPFRWQSGFSLDGLKRGDVVVVCGDLHELSSLWVAIRAKIRGLHVVWWGHHVSALAREGRVAIRLAIAKMLSDVMLCYTDAGIHYLESRGFKRGTVFATGNTIDLASVEKATIAWNGVRKCGARKTLLFCGVLREKVRLDVLLKAIALLMTKRKDISCIMIGDGEMAGVWKSLSKKLGLDEVVIWTGELRGQDKLAPWFLSADLFVYPGRIGLSLVHALSYGLPVLLNDNLVNHGPEYVVFKPGQNGLSYHENDEVDLAEKIDFALNKSDLKMYGENGRRTVFAQYSMSRMVDRFSEAIEAASQMG